MLPVPKGGDGSPGLTMSIRVPVLVPVLARTCANKFERSTVGWHVDVNTAALKGILRR